MIYRHPLEKKLADELDKARTTISDMISEFISRLSSFGSTNDVWIEVGKDKRLGLLSGFGGVHDYQLVLQDGDENRSLHDLDVHELKELFVFFPKLRSAVIAESYDHLDELKSAINAFREDVMNVSADSDSEYIE